MAVTQLQLETSRRCWTCRKVKPIHRFHRNRWCKGGRLRHCNSCAAKRRLANRTPQAQDSRPYFRTEFPFEVRFLGGPNEGVRLPLRSFPPPRTTTKEAEMLIGEDGRVIENVLRFHVYYRWVVNNEIRYVYVEAS